jgi:hypothetical protein
MTIKDISIIRLRNQMISSTELITARDVVSWMGALQAQDFSMVKWAVGIRLPKSTDREIEAAINEGEILRTHLLRPTLHLISSYDIRWILALTAPWIRVSLKSRSKDLDLTESIIKKSNSIITDALKGDNHLTREELVTILKGAGINTSGQRGYHILARAELDGLICSGRVKANKQTFALLNERVLKTSDIEKDEALEKLARKYFSSRGPATLRDFKWWSGLSVADSRSAIEMTGKDLISLKVGQETYLTVGDIGLSGNENSPAHFLPAFDEFLICYTDRSASLPKRDFSKAVSSNGVFRPVIVVDGQVVGLWKRKIKKEKLIIETLLFEKASKSVIKCIENGIEKLERFSERKTELLILTL